MTRRYIDPVTVVLMLGVMLAILIDFAFVATHISVVQIELLVILSIVCIAGLWYAGHEYESLHTYRDQYHSFKTLIPALGAEQAVAIIATEYLAAKSATDQLQWLRAQRSTPNAPSLRQLRAQERETSSVRIKYINLCRMLHQNGIAVPPELALSDPWQWERMMETPLPK